VKVGVVTFPGSLDDVDARRAVTIGGNEAVALWHGDDDLRGVDAVVLPGGFSYGDNLRCGAIARYTPVMSTIIAGAGQRLRIERVDTPWTSAYAAGAEVTIVLKNGEGGFVADEPTLDRLEGEGRVVARYLDDNPNGSLRDIAGISNERGNVVGLMPHPEHAVEDLCGPGTDGLGFFTGLAERVFG
jgi:phosphoribosylformylglycinamidine synthase